MSGLSALVQDIVRNTASDSKPMSAIEFIESPWGLNFRLFPAQRVIVKCYYGISLDQENSICHIPKRWQTIIDRMDLAWEDFDEDEIADQNRLTDMFLEEIATSDLYHHFTEWEYVQYLHDEGRCNLRPEEVCDGNKRTELILAIGRQSGKSKLSSCFAAYEVYQLLLKENPQKYYGKKDGEEIQIISVATDKDQAGILFNDVSSHFSNARFFARYHGTSTLSYVRMQTKDDYERHGPFQQSQKASIRITFKSCVAKGLRGPRNILVIMDEMAHFTNAGQTSAEEVYNAVTPSLTSFAPKGVASNGDLVALGPVEGRLICISSPFTRNGKFYELFQAGMSSAKVKRKMLCIRAPTWEINPTVPASYFASEFAKDAQKFRTEYGAEFSDRVRGWIEREEDLLACIDVGRKPQARGLHRVSHFCGIDIGLVDDGCGLAICHNEDGKIIVDVVDHIKAGEGRFDGYPRLQFDDIAFWIHGWAGKYNIHEALFDQWNGIVLEQKLQKMGLKQFHSEKLGGEKGSDMFKRFKEYIYDARLRLYDWPKTMEDGRESDHCAYIRELLQLEEERKTKTKIEVRAPQVAGMHDDMSDAIVRAVWLASENLHKTKHTTDRRGGSTGTGTRNMANAKQYQRRRMRRHGVLSDRMAPRKRRW